MEPSFATEPFANVHLNDRPEEADLYFEKLRDTLFRRFAKPGSSSEARMMFCESGWLERARRYFYIKPMSQPGWFFERSGAGWVVARSEKVVARDLFLRKGEPWDIATLYRLEGGIRLRVASEQFGPELIGFADYEQQMIQALEYDAAP